MANSLEGLTDKQDQDPSDGGGGDGAVDAVNNPTPPQLSLFSLPRKPLEPPGMLTPPLHSKAASVPFKWEEAPGKPRHCRHAAEPKPAAAAGCLDLPPRLLSGAAVHDGPYYPGRAPSFRTLGGSFRSPESRSRRDIRERVTFGSMRWGFPGKERVSGVVEGSPGISLSVLYDDGGVGEESVTKVKITRVSRRKSFFSLSHAKSHLWESIYGGFKQVVPWRRRQDKPHTKGH
ncbi:uncharacterized protein At4g00950-like [Syzygium oleosum]|uniref:uncharacterized protein At4g00950-like n=1 Tax=Syzygium oleosum TaxID=219896 RepID=UPI0024BA4173|nr:uncharacterized protein At4g00950-like [Syzygium oleosum]